MIITVIQLLLLFFTMGRPSNLKLAIVNEEIQSHSEYSNEMTTSVSSKDGKCSVEKASSMFINELDEKTVIKSFFNVFDEGYEELKHARVVALLWIGKNFSQSTTDFIGSEDQNPVSIAQNTIEVYRDRTVISASMEMEKEISKAFSSQLRKIFKACNQSSIFLEPPLSFKEPIYGSTVFDFKDCVAHVVITL